jgi:hypothetical protein
VKLEEYIERMYSETRRFVESHPFDRDELREELTVDSE